MSFTSIVTSVPTAISLNMRLSGLSLKPLSPPGRRQRHLRRAIINRGERTCDEARSPAGFPFWTGIHNHIAFVDPERHFIADFRSATTLAS